MMHSCVYIPKGDKDLIKAMLIHILVKPKWGYSMNHWWYNLPPVMPIRYPKPTRHVEP